MQPTALSPPVKSCVVCTLAAGLASLAALALHNPPPPLGPFLVWTLMLVATEATALELPCGGFITVSGVVDYAGILCYGPLLVGWADVVSVLLYQGLWLKKPLHKVTFNAGLYALTTVAAGCAYVALGGPVGTTHFAHAILPLLTLGAVYFTVNSGGLSLVISLAERRNPLALWRDNFRWGLLQHWSMLPLGMLLALLTLTGGLLAATLAVFPLFLARYSFMAHLRARSDLKDFVRAISKVLDAVDPFTREHSLRVAGFSVRMARDLRMSSQDVEMVEYAALMHDLGKITNEARPLISKPGILTRDEKSRLDQHPVLGASLFEQVRSLRRAADFVRSHHERMDGRGYPMGLVGKQIPLGSRILAVADCYDAMTSDRPYVRARSPQVALAELRRFSGTQFDAVVVECFCRMVEVDLSRAPAPSPWVDQLAATAPEMGGPVVVAGGAAALVAAAAAVNAAVPVPAAPAASTAVPQGV
ncbi:MAG TPA: HD domain-containing phosphohydrolase [Candidatus Saccharimonadales bacterium]|nr:HD domain-containing phosphohydrolase [Candidatus Saccharimonadales bacterium]